MDVPQRPDSPPIETSKPPLILPVVSEKNDQNSSSLENLLLSKIPPSFCTKAKLLLQAFDENPQQLTWNDQGEVFINSESVPNADIFKLFPAVFKTPVLKNKNLPGFIEFVREIGGLGLAHLIHPKLLRGFKRKQKIQNQKELFEEIKNDKWFYLGPI